MADTMTTDATPGTAEECFELGMIHASGRDGAVDMVTAHKWFNIAASRGHGEAAAQRREVAAQMTDSEIGTAQRAARDWLKAHPLPAVTTAMPELRIAA
jgi:TPR repeat protein